VIPPSVAVPAIASTEFAVVEPAGDAKATPHLLAAVLRSLWTRVQATFLTRSSSLSRRRLQESDLLQILIPWQDNDNLHLNEQLGFSVDARQQAVRLVNEAESDVTRLIEGTLDKQRLLAESAKLEDWLHEHASRFSATIDGASSQ
jgi:hypothetical protein